jgi:hypothetical protein
MNHFRLINSLVFVCHFPLVQLVQNWNSSSSILSVVKGDVDGPESSSGLIQATSGQSIKSGKKSSGSILAPRVPSNKNKSRSKTG